MFRKYFYKAVIKSFDDYDSLSTNVSRKESLQLSLSSGSKVAAALTSCAGYSEPLTLAHLWAEIAMNHATMNPRKTKNSPQHRVVGHCGYANFPGSTKTNDSSKPFVWPRCVRAWGRSEDKTFLTSLGSQRPTWQHPFQFCIPLYASMKTYSTRLHSKLRSWHSLVEIGNATVQAHGIDKGDTHQVLVSSPPSAGLITRTRSLFWPEGVKLKASHHQPVNVASISHTQWVVYTGLLPTPTTHSTRRQRNNRQEKWLTKTWIFCLEFQLHGGRVVICFSVGPTHDGLDWVERV